MRFLRAELEKGTDRRTIVRQYNQKYFGGRQVLNIGELNRLAEEFKDAAPVNHPNPVRVNRCGIFGRS